jgi:hypothetical protein
MGPSNLKFGGGVSETFLNPLVLLAVLIACAFICFAPRQKALSAFLVTAILIPTDQIMVLAGVHFPMLRVLALAGFVRLARERRKSKTWLFAGGMNRLDGASVLLTGTTAISGIILFHEFGAFVYQAGLLCTQAGTYLLLRLFIRDEDDVLHAIRTLTLIACFIAIIMSYEVKTGHNPYAALGGARAARYTHILERDDRYRASGPFGTPILAGTCGAVMVPLFVALWWRNKKYRLIAAAGVAGGAVMTLTCNASTPILGLAAGVGALCLWPVRRLTRTIRWCAVIVLVVLQFVMNHPVWHLLMDIDISGGSSGYHRYMLIDQCIQHFSDWWLVGVQSTASWGWDMWDTANQYVATCENSGLISFLLFISVLVYAFKYLGRTRRALEVDPRRARFAWGLSSALFANVVAFLGISYWDQTQVLGYLLMVMTSAMFATTLKSQAEHSKLSRPKTEPAPQLKPEGAVCVAGWAAPIPVPSPGRVSGGWRTRLKRLQLYELMERQNRLRPHVSIEQSSTRN